ncbi:MAG: hypothetical protein AAGA75_19125 [Cyanobacteria bacterium P01_E01_bin.6]
MRIAEYLESAHKHYGTTILLTAATRHAATDAIETCELDHLLLPGSTEPTTIYELLSSSEAFRTISGDRWQCLRFLTALASWSFCCEL